MDNNQLNNGVGVPPVPPVNNQPEPVVDQTTTATPVEPVVQSAAPVQPESQTMGVDALMAPPVQEQPASAQVPEPTSAEPVQTSVTPVGNEPNKKPSDKKTIIIIAAVVGIVFLIAIIVIVAGILLSGKKSNNSSSTLSKADYVCTLDMGTTDGYSTNITVNFYYNKDGYSLIQETIGEFKADKMDNEMIGKIIGKYFMWGCDPDTSTYDEEVCTGKASFYSSEFGLSTEPSIKGNTLTLKGVDKMNEGVTLKDSDIKSLKEAMEDSGFNCK